MTTMALERIAENRRRHAAGLNARTLNLGSCGLTQIPKEIADLTWLEYLSFGRQISARQPNDLLALDRPEDVANRIESLQSPRKYFGVLDQLGKRRGGQNPFEKLTNLRGLWLGSSKAGSDRCYAADLHALSHLTNLEVLGAPHTRASDLFALCGLSKLRVVDVSSSKVASIEALSTCRELASLYAADTGISSLDGVSNLKKLRIADLSGTAVRELSYLQRLSAMEVLYIAGTPVTSLAGLETLSNLKRLDLANTAVSDLEVLCKLPLQLLILGSHHCDLRPLLPLIRDGMHVIASDSTMALSTLDESGNIHAEPFTKARRTIMISERDVISPPAEVVQRGSAAIMNYFRERDAQGVDRLYEAKVLLVGEGGAGKTALLRRLYQPDRPLPEPSETTRGIDIHKHQFKLRDDRSFRLNIWDFGGQEIYRSTHQFFLTKRSLYVLLDDTRQDYKSVHDAGFKDWLEVVSLLSDNSPVLIFQNEKGGRSKAIDIAGIKGKFPNVRDVYRGDLNEPDAADALRDALEHYAQLLPHVGEELPAKWIAIRADLEARAAILPYIPQAEYFAIYAAHLPFDRDKALHLSRYLHDLGVFLHFQDDALLNRWVFLRNEWATGAVFAILDDEAVKTARGRFTAADCNRLWDGPDYANMHPELLALMQNFELCYLLPGSKPDQWLATQLLPPSKPNDLVGWGAPLDLVLRYRYEFLPKGMIGRLVVRLHRFVSRPDLAWTTGALLEHERTQLLVEIPARGGEIVIRARGPENKALLSVVAAELDALNETFQGLPKQVTQWIPCNCVQCSAVTEPEFFEKKRLIQRKAHGRLTVECPSSYQEVQVLELLDGVRLEHPPEWALRETQIGHDMDLPPLIIRIFLASSNEVESDRKALAAFIREQNDALRPRHVYLQVVQWEHFLDAMSKTRQQDQYNAAVRECDIFVALLFTKTGRYSEEEFDTAHAEFLRSNKPLIYTYFRDEKVNLRSIKKESLESLWRFQEKLTLLGHFWQSYTSSEGLMLSFSEQLTRIIYQKRGIDAF